MHTWGSTGSYPDEYLLEWRNGIRTALRTQRGYTHGGSIPLLSTTWLSIPTVEEAVLETVQSEFESLGSY